MDVVEWWDVDSEEVSEEKEWFVGEVEPQGDVDPVRMLK